jgi:hypothetical protein
MSLSLPILLLKPSKRVTTEETAEAITGKELTPG